MEATKEKIYDVAPDENSLIEQLFSVKMDAEDHLFLAAIHDDRYRDRILELLYK